MDIKKILTQIDSLYGAYAVLELNMDGSGEIYQIINDNGNQMTIKIFENLEVLEQFLNEKSQ
jgi:hypothetical protein